MNMKKLLVLLVLLLAFGSVANAQQFIQSQTLTSTAAATNYGAMQQNSNVVTHVLTWTAAAGTGRDFILYTSAPVLVRFHFVVESRTCTNVHDDRFIRDYRGVHVCSGHDYGGYANRERNVGVYVSWVYQSAEHR
jgi:hypothetical protein